MSLADDAKLLLIPTGYKTSKVYSVFPTDGDGDFTYTRSGDASRVNPGGLIETVGTNIPRIDHTGGGCPTLNLEPLRTNYALNSTQMHLNNTLTASGSTITKTGNYAISPDGTLTVTRLQVSGSGSGYALLSVNGTNPTTDLNANGYYMSSVYVKSNTGSNQTISFYGSGTQTSKIHEITNEWQRIQILAYRPANAKYAYIGYAASISNIDTNLDFLVWGGQTEIVDNYITSFIPTGATIETRQKDNCHLLNQTLFTDFPFTVYAKAKVDNFSNVAFSLIDSIASNKYLSIQFTSSSQIGVLRRDSLNNDSDYYSFSYSIGDTLKIAISYVNDTSYKLYVNGTELADITSGTSIPFDHNDISLGQFRIASDTGTRNSIDDFRVYDYTLNDTELTELTTL